MAADATAADIKSAYRKAALQTHPDVSDAPDATQQFSQLSSAYGECLAPAVLHLPVLSTYKHALAWLRPQLVGAPVWQFTGLVLHVRKQCVCQPSQSIHAMNDATETLL